MALFDLDAPALRNPHRHITDNDSSGRSFFSDILPTALPVVNQLGTAHQRFGYLVPPGPADLTDQADLRLYENALKNLPPLVPIGGHAAVWYIDMPPGTDSPMHRTVSLDIVIQIEGEVELTLENGDKRTVRPGDLTIQRSTLHAWCNTSPDKWSRMIGIMAECRPVEAGGKVLGPEFPSH
jgi:quercetin dioxygenase-like cupin family protein